MITFVGVVFMLAILILVCLCLGAGYVLKGGSKTWYTDNVFLNNANTKKCNYITKRRSLTNTNGIVDEHIDILRDYPTDYLHNYAVQESTP